MATKRKKSITTPSIYIGVKADAVRAAVDGIKSILNGPGTPDTHMAALQCLSQMVQPPTGITIHGCYFGLTGSEPR